MQKRYGTALNEIGRIACESILNEIELNLKM